MDEASLQFHIENEDCFGTLSTVLDLVGQRLKKEGSPRHAEVLLRLRDRLMYLQREYRIEKLGPPGKPGPSSGPLAQS
jgi:hypothetical protein